MLLLALIGWCVDSEIKQGHNPGRENRRHYAHECIQNQIWASVAPIEIASEQTSF